MATRDQLEQALRNADAAGDIAAARQLARAIQNKEYQDSGPEKAMVQPPQNVSRETPASGNYLRDLTRQALQGMTLGFSDEIGATMASTAATLDKGPSWLKLLPPQLLPPIAAVVDRDYVPRYKEMVGNIRDEQSEFAEANPKASMAANIVGGLLTGGTGAVRTGAVQSLPKLAAYGGITGGVSGAGVSEADDIVGLGEDVLMGAGTGTVLGTAVPMAGRAIGGAVERLVRPGQSKIESTVRKGIEDSDMVPEEALSRLQQNPNLLLGDLSENLRDRVRGLANLPGAAKERAKGILEDRTTQQAARIMPEIRAGLGADTKYYDALPQLSADMSKKARPLYDKAYKTEISIEDLPKNISDIFSKAAENGALRNARKLAAAEMENFDEMPLFRGLDYVKRGLQDLEGSALRAGRGQLARGIGGQRKALGDYLKDISPEYRQANKIWAGGSADQEAMEAGLKALSKDSDFNRSAFKAMSDSEKKAFRVGVMQAIQNKVNTMSDDRNVVRQLKMIPKNRELIKLAFRDKGKFDRFMNKLDDEEAMFETFASSLRGSRTAPLLTAQQLTNDALQMGAGAAAGSPLGVLSPVARTVSRVMGGPLEQRNAHYRGLLSDALLDNRMGQDVLRGLLGPRPYPAALGGVGATAPLIAP